MQVIFLHHSSFLIEVDDKVLIFDYFNGDKVPEYHFTGKIPTYERDTEIYMFSSHRHQDHFDLDCLKLVDMYPNIHFIFSKDIRLSKNYLTKHGFDLSVLEHITFIGPDQKKKIVDGLMVSTLRSTDVGVAFYVDAWGVTLYHAGDLNDWKWEGAGDLINGKMQRDYRFWIHKLAKKPINFAFVPMDPRLKQHQFLGIDYFVRTTDAEYIFPMHMWQDYSGIKAYKKQITNKSMAERIVEIERENQVFVFGENR